MSFSAQVKEELTEHIGGSRHCRLAELSALVSMSGYYNKEYSQVKDSQTVIPKINRLFRKLELEPDSDEAIQSLKLKNVDGRYVVDRQLIERQCCKQSYVRGAFLAAGSVTDPQKGYHFEIVCDSEPESQILMDCIMSFGIEPRVVMRKRYYVVYIKDGSMIVDMLNIMGAHISLMNMENVRILKDMRNSVNRKVNCETANINKTVSAAVKQIEDINYINEVKGLKYLPDNLRQIAELRLDEPEISLKDLGEMLNPPIGKSGVNHRLRKISEIANELRRNNND